MKCPRCQAENPEAKRFCRRCGARLLLVCPQCGCETLPGDRFCGECGEKLEAKEATERREPTVGGERKQITVLFSDLTGYTTMSERLDPEEVREIMSRIFGEIAQVVTKYEGSVEKVIGDAVMAVFGLPKAHEDDPVRAIQVAREIHSLVETLSSQLEERVGQSLSMHTGINTGLVVTGETDLERGSSGAAGDTINLASRLTDLARAGEILVGPETYWQAEGYFAFKGLEPTRIRGKARPVQIYRVSSSREKPNKTHRLHGLRADLIGRKVEMTRLAEAARALRQGKGTILSICGDAGTGKSRLVEEFRATLDPDEFQWREGHAYAYSQNIPYFPIIDLLNRAWQIEEGDSPEKVKQKIESGVQGLIGKKGDIVTYIGSLYSFTYPETDRVSPESWKSHLQGAIQAILSALARRGPTVICLEDLHWADPSSLDLLRFVVSEFRYPALFLCIYRLPFSLFTSLQLRGMGNLQQEIQLRDLSPSEAQDMMESLLKTKAIPPDLRRFIQEKVEGNLFYLEEVINSLVESETLFRDNDDWQLTRPISESDIPPTIHGVISARLDRLDKEMKRLLQEASVIGRVFLQEILKRTTELKEPIGQCLNGLERLDLIRTRSLQPDLEYTFKHALTQEVVYNRLLKKERHGIHERVALVMEEVFQDRLSEFYETLAYHFKRGQSVHKAIDYLAKSGVKSLKRYAVEESHQYFKEAFDLLSSKPGKSGDEERLLIDLLNQWALVFNHRGDFKGLEDLLSAHEDRAKALDDKARLGMFYAWLGFALCCREKYGESFHYLDNALRLGEEIENQQVIAYACALLSYTSAEMGHLDKALVLGQRAQELSRVFQSDHFLYFISLSGIGQAYWHRGETKNAFQTGKALLDHGEKHFNIRSLVRGHYITGWSHFTDGDFSSAIDSFERAIRISADPYYAQFPRLGLVYSHVSMGQFQEAEKALQEVMTFSQRFGVEMLGTPAHGLLGLVAIGKGQVNQGIRMLEKAQRVWLEKQRRCLYAASEYMLGKVYAAISQRAAPISLSMMIKNIGLVRTIPFTSQKAEGHFNKAIAVAKEIGAKATLGMAYLDLGLLHRAKGKTDQARQCISTAVQIFEQCESVTYLRQAKKALESLG